MNGRDPERVPYPESLRSSPVVAVLRAEHARQYGPVIRALVDGGVTHIELTLSTAGVFEELSALIAEFDGSAIIGLGTVTEAAEARRGIESGAAYLVTPAMHLEVVEAAREAGVPVFPGGFTPTELLQGWTAGASAVKLFPATLAGSRYLADLHGPFPEMRVMPSGGVTLESAVPWLEAGACAVSIGGPLLQDAFSGGELSELRSRAASLSADVASWLDARGGDHD